MEKVDCKECEGSGKIPYEDKPEYSFTCNVCGGTGKVIEEEEPKNHIWEGLDV